MSRLASRIAGTAGTGQTRDRRLVNDSLSIYLEDQTHPELLVNPQKKVRRVSTKRADIPSYRERQTLRAPPSMSAVKRASSKQASDRAAAVYSRQTSSGRRAGSGKSSARMRTQGNLKSSTSNAFYAGLRNKERRETDDIFDVQSDNGERSPSYLRESVGSGTPTSHQMIDRVRSAVALAKDDNNGIDFGPSIDFQEPRRSSRSTLRTDTKSVRSNSLFHKPLPSQQPPNRSNSAYESTLSHRMYSPIVPHQHSTMDSSVSRSSSHLSQYPKSTIKTDDIRERVKLQQNAAQALLRDYVFLVGYNPRYLSKSMLADGYQEAREISEGDLQGRDLEKKKKELLGKLVGDIAHLRSSGHSGGSYSALNSMIGDTGLNVSVGEAAALPTIDEDMQFDDVTSSQTMPPKDDKGMQRDLPNMVDTSVSTDIERHSCIHNDTVPTKDEASQSVISDIMPPRQFMPRGMGQLKPSGLSTLHIKVDNPDKFGDSENNQTSVTTEPEVSETLSQNPGLLVKGVVGNNDPIETDLHTILDDAVHRDNHKDSIRHARRESRSARPPTTSSLYNQDTTPERRKRTATSARTPTRERCDFIYNYPVSSIYGQPISGQSGYGNRTPGAPSRDNAKNHIISSANPINISLDDGSEDSSGISGIADNDCASKGNPAGLTPQPSKLSISTNPLLSRITRKNSAVSTPVGMVRNNGPFLSPTKVPLCCGFCDSPLSPRQGASSEKHHSNSSPSHLDLDKGANAKAVCPDCYHKFIDSVMRTVSTWALNGGGIDDGTTVLVPKYDLGQDLEDLPIGVRMFCEHSNGSPHSVINLEACKGCSHYKSERMSPDNRDAIDRVTDIIGAASFYPKHGNKRNLACFNDAVLRAEVGSDSNLGTTFCQGAVPLCHTNDTAVRIENSFNTLRITVAEDATAMHDIATGLHQWGLLDNNGCSRGRLDGHSCAYMCPFQTAARLLLRNDAVQPATLSAYTVKSSCPDDDLETMPLVLDQLGDKHVSPLVQKMDSMAVMKPHADPKVGASNPSRQSSPYNSYNTHSTYVPAAAADPAPNPGGVSVTREHTTVVNEEYTYTYSFVPISNDTVTATATTTTTTATNTESHPIKTRNEGTTAAPQLVQEAVQASTAPEVSTDPAQDTLSKKELMQRVNEYIGLLDLKRPQCTSTNPERCFCHICLANKDPVKRLKPKRRQNIG